MASMRSAAWLAVVGGLLWTVLFPVGAATWPRPETGQATPELLVWLRLGAVPLAMLLASVVLAGVPPARMARAGHYGLAAGFATMLVGNLLEAWAPFGGVLSSNGHLAWLLGGLVTFVAAVVYGLARRRGAETGLARAVAWVHILALPIGLAGGLALRPVFPGTDAGFWLIFTLGIGAGRILWGLEALRQDGAPKAPTVPRPA